MSSNDRIGVALVGTGIGLAATTAAAAVVGAPILLGAAIVGTGATALSYLFGKKK